ncbi:Cytochrome c oxidase copper chaperone [Dispira simplex]|nr:Cytochrome c oxidase copper chaperone [Dispira simplex]
MGASQSKTADSVSPVSQPTTTTTTSNNAGDEKPKLKPCCACPETKKPRDECVLMKGEENCQDLIEKHKACLRSHGFNV